MASANITGQRAEPLDAGTARIDTQLGRVAGAANLGDTAALFSPAPTPSFVTGTELFATIGMGQP